MRTTIELDPDVAALIEREIAITNRAIDVVANERLRRGFAVGPATNTERVQLPKPLQLGKTRSRILTKSPSCKVEIEMGVFP